MFGFFTSQEKRMREDAGNWLELADKVYHYRRDVLPAAQVGELETAMRDVRGLVKERAGIERLKPALEALQKLLQHTGGAIYPKSALVENVEFFLVAAIVILGIRTYFVQPFKIPTNSMWPTYNGMTPEVFRSTAEEPGYVAQVARFAAFGASTRRVDAPADGEIAIPFDGGLGRIAMTYKNVPGKTWLVIPTTLKEYTLYVGDKPATITVPADFDFEWAVREAYFPTGTPSREPGGVDLARIAREDRRRIVRGPNGEQMLLTGKTVKRGERALAFDILTGDQLFVDRMSYHFVKPSVGSGFVFRTGNIEGIARTYGDQYYIKRLVGAPGDTLEIRDFGLWRNGAPATGTPVFEKNAQRTDSYVGYRYGGLLMPGSKVQLKDGEYFAMGDNSANSADGREWGAVPGKDTVGRPIFVYYPFTRHWGPAK